MFRNLQRKRPVRPWAVKLHWSPPAICLATNKGGSSVFLVEIEHFLGHIQVFRPELLNPFLERNHNFDEQILVFNIFQLPIVGPTAHSTGPFPHLPTAPAEQIPHLLAARPTPGLYGIIEKHWETMLRFQWIWGNSTGMEWTLMEWTCAFDKLWEVSWTKTSSEM